ncbi:MAG TPA: chemotaxis protein CheD [Clostridia bacterium]|nr:chemotaxis protein CheD [Clostridia bacterium]
MLKTIDLTKEVSVGIADYKISSAPDKLITFGLGSCVGISLYDPILKLGGLLHIMLPDSTQFSKDKVSNQAKFADLGIPLIVREMRLKGAKTLRLQAKLVGGAQMFSGFDKKLLLNIGERNSIAAKKILKSMGIKVLAEDLGGNTGRTMVLDTMSGQVHIRTLGKNQKVV